MDPMVIIMIAYTVGTCVGIHWGFKSGIRTGTDLTVNTLLSGNYLKSRVINGNVELVKLDTDAP
jgi:hypothetical protein